MQLRFQRSERETLFSRSYRRIVSNLGFDVIPHYGFALGNAYTYGNVGVTVGSARISRTIMARSCEPEHSRVELLHAARPFRLVHFRQHEGRAVARNLFLEGNTFQDSRGVSTVPLVGDVQVGAALIWSHARLSYTHVWRTKEFQTQVAGDQFGALSCR